jgi:hypothetical protein
MGSVVNVWGGWGEGVEEGVIVVVVVIVAGGGKEVWMVWSCFFRRFP